MELIIFWNANPLVTVDFVNENKGWVSGCCGMFMGTTNAGVSWTPETYLTLGFTINSMMFPDENNGWLAGDAGYILRTTNGGTNWDSLNSTTTSGLYSVFFTGNDTGFVVGHSGLILKTTNGGGEGFPIGIEKISSIVPQQFSLRQNYPNPFNPVTNFEFEIPASQGVSGSQFVSIKIFDILGKESAVLFDGNVFPGKYKIMFDGSRLMSGVYFYKIEAVSANELKYSEVRKMVLLK